MTIDVNDNFTEAPGVVSERGRRPAMYRPAAALPMSALRSESYASPFDTFGFARPLLTCGEIALEPPEGLTPESPLVEAARRLATSQSGYLPILEDERLIGAVYIEDVLKAIGELRDPAATPAAQIGSKVIPSVAPEATVADAVRLMLASYLRRLPVVTKDGKLLGFVTLSEAAAAASWDGAVRDVLGKLALSPSLWARRSR